MYSEVDNNAQNTFNNKLYLYSCGSLLRSPCASSLLQTMNLPTFVHQEFPRRLPMRCPVPGNRFPGAESCSQNLWTTSCHCVTHRCWTVGD